MVTARAMNFPSTEGDDSGILLPVVFFPAEPTPLGVEGEVDDDCDGGGDDCDDVVDGDGDGAGTDALCSQSLVQSARPSGHWET